MKFKDYLIVAALVVVDQLTKYYVSITLTLNKSIEIIKNFFYLTYCQNDGAAFSILRGNRTLFIILTSLVVAILVYYLTKNKVCIWEKISYLLIIAGALGNLIDRLYRSVVIDFLDFYIFGYDFPVFNFADICVTIGVFLLIIITLIGGKNNESN